MANTAFNQDVARKEQERVQQVMESKAYVANPELLGWYVKDLESLKPITRALFEQYSKIPTTEVVSHVKQVRDDAFKIFPYPCLGNWGFLDLSVRQSSAYDEVLDRLKGGEQLIDVGCCMGQDIRKLVHDGVPSENIHGTDLKKEFWAIGHDLFLDKSTLKTPFIEADVFDADSALRDVNGRFNIAFTASFFHLFDWDSQVRAAKRVVQLLKPEPGSLVIGRQGGKVKAGDFSQVRKEMMAFWHNPESWTKLWTEVGDQTNSSWKVEAILGEEVDTSKQMKTRLVPDGMRFMSFTVRRL